MKNKLKEKRSILDCQQKNHKLILSKFCSVIGGDKTD